MAARSPVRSLLSVPDRTAQRRVLFAAAACIVLWHAVAALVLLPRPAWGDEAHTVDTIRAFSAAPRLSFVRDYPQTAGPLTFMLYGAWGRIAGVSLPALRVLSLLLSLAAAWIFLRLLLAMLDERRAVAAALAAYLLNPYVVGLAVFVYTDTLTLLCVMVFLAALRARRHGVLFFATACGLLTRQYFAFLPLAAVVCATAEFLRARKPDSGALLTALVAGALPLLALFLLWHGVAPPSGAERWAPGEHLTYRFPSLALYAALLPLATLPALLLRARRHRFNFRTELLLLLSAGAYLLMPVAPSRVAVEQAGVRTVGFFHRGLLWLWENALFVHAVFLALFWAGLHLLWRALLDARALLVRREYGFPLFLALVPFAFLLLMPLSYQRWEKYLLPLLPALLLFVLRRESDGAAMGG
jgi:hypothetical protein